MIDHLYKKICRMVHAQMSIDYGKYYKAEFDNIQHVVKVNDNVDNLKTYAECNCQSLTDLKQCHKFIFHSKEDTYQFSMIGTDGSQMLHLEFPPKNIHG